jgi:trigger factor
MNIEREETGNLTATLNLVLAPEDYAPGVEKTLKQQRKTAAWPGFRPGQVPMSIVKKRIGRDVLVGEVQRLVDEHLRHYITENKLRVLGQPLPNDTARPNNWDQPGEMAFKFDLAMAPEFDVDGGTDLGVTLPMVDVEGELLDKEVNDLRRRFGTLQDVERAEGEDMLFGDLIELDAQGEIVPGGLMNRTTITLADVKNDAARQELIGKAAGDAVAVDPHHVSADHDDLAKMLGTDHERVHRLPGKLLFRIAEVKRMQPAEIGQELFDRVLGPGQVSDVAGFRAKVGEGLQGMLRRDAERIFKRLALRAITDRANIELPDAFLKRWIAATSQKPITPAELEAGYTGYADGLRRQLVEDRIVEKYGLEAKGEELNEFAKHAMADQFAQLGMPAPEGERLQEMAGRLLGDRDQIKRMRDAIVDQKLTAHFKAKLSPQEKKLSLDEFVNLARTA